jgi:hypothetical protein
LRCRSGMLTTRIGRAVSDSGADTSTAARRARMKDKERSSTKSASASCSKHGAPRVSFDSASEDGDVGVRAAPIIAEGPRARPRGGKSHQTRLGCTRMPRANRLGRTPVALMRCRLRSAGSSE